jgi:hypothetical protein
MCRYSLWSLLDPFLILAEQFASCQGQGAPANHAAVTNSLYNRYVASIVWAVAVPEQSPV